tara:strand:- start:2137 stop:2589 length:453 start_codon:yes stop_codon:yes gene_type:complete
MLNRFVKILTLGLLFCGTAYAEEPQFTFLDEGEPAPFTGTLFNPQATAELVAMPEYMQNEFDIELEYQLDLQATEYNFQLTNSQIRYDALTQEYDATVLALTQQNESLEQALAQRKKNRNGLMFAAGTATGVVITTAIVYAILSASASGK